jgi:hypothetical protein
MITTEKCTQRLDHDAEREICVSRRVTQISTARTAANAGLETSGGKTDG